MKRIISLICILSVLFCASGVFAELDYGQKVANPGLDFPVDESTVMKNGTLIFEAEDMTIGPDMTVMEDDSASGGYMVKATESGMISNADELANPSMVLNFTADSSNTYYFWVRIKTPANTNSSIHYSINGQAYATLWCLFNEGNDWEWKLLGSANLTAGEASVEFKRRLRGFTMDKIVITSNTSYASNGDGLDELTYENSQSSALIYDLPDIVPIESHPRLLVTEEGLPAFIAKMSSEELAPMYEKCLALVDEELDCDMGGTKYDDSLMTKLKARAIAYLTGARDENHARQTIEYMKEYFTTCYYNPKIGDITRNIGDCMFTGAIIYDWCYDVMTEADKEYFIRYFKTLAAQKECGYPPTNMLAISGHLGEQEIFQDLLGAGVACYDEDPEMYNLAAGRLFQEMVESRKAFNDTGAHPVSFEYAMWRHACEGVADLIYSRMGYGHIFGDNMYLPSYRFMYARLGMGKWIKDGDSFEYAYNTKYDYDTYDYQDMTIIGNLYRDPYLRGQYIRDMAIKSNAFNFWVLICAEPDVDFKSEETLPLAYMASEPQTSIIARTSWKHGIDSPAAVAYLDGHERIINDHPHMSIGQFSLYYKGNLAIDSGNYNGSAGGYGSSHDKNYYKRTIASNCVTVFDPDEKFYWATGNGPGIGYLYGTGEEVANDGGQKFRINVRDYDEFKEIDAMARTDGSYIGPNKQTPEFSYLKTDLTNAYSDKISEYNRYMVFMDLDNEDYPAALVVFDVVESSNKAFKKVWNLHSIEEPEVSGNTTVISRTEDGFNGKLVNKTLLPETGNFNIEKVGGEGMEYMVNGVNYPNDDHEGTKTDSGSWRIELSPVKESTKDTFLNAMYVTDYDRNLPELRCV